MKTYIISGIVVIFALIVFAAFGCSTDNTQPKANADNSEQADQPKAETPAPPETRPQTKCPVMGNDIKKEYYVDYKGFRVYFCCPGCDKTFNENPDKYIRKMKAQGVELEKIK